MTPSASGISFVFPMYNEAENIAGTIARAARLGRDLSGDNEIVVADDASTDASVAIVEKIASADPRVKLVRLAKNSKFGGALKAGIRAASKDIIIYTDSDFPAKEDDIRKALAALDGADIVTAYSLVIKDTSFKRIVMSRGYNFLVHCLCGLRIHDVNSGLKIFRRSVFDGMELRAMSPFIDAEIFAEAIRKGAVIRQYGLIFELRNSGVSTISRPAIVARTFADMLAYWARSFGR